MKLLCLPLLFFSTHAFAGDTFTCTTQVKEGYYIQRTMTLSFSDSSVFARLQEPLSEKTFSGSVGNLSTTKTDGTHVYKGFDSTEMFGELSEGAADLGIYLYVSAEVQSGQSGRVTLLARGTEAGLEKATYSCSR